VFGNTKSEDQIVDVVFTYKFGHTLRAYKKNDALNKKIRKREILLMLKAEKEPNEEKKT
jgi:hypothetical protein